MQRQHMGDEFWIEREEARLEAELAKLHSTGLTKGCSEGERAAEKRYVDTKFLSSYIGFRVETIRRWVKSKKIPFYKIGGRLRFDLRQVDEWLQARKGKEFTNEKDN